MELTDIINPLRHDPGTNSDVTLVLIEGEERDLKRTGHIHGHQRRPEGHCPPGVHNLSVK